MEILFGYRYKTPDGFNAIAGKFKGKFVYMDLKSSYLNPFKKIVPKTKKYLLSEIITHNNSLL